MIHDVMASFAIDAHSFGSLSAIATFCYALLQVPAGILSDLYGSRRMVLVSIFLCAFGVALFSFSNSLFLAYMGRIFIGSGSACAFLCVSKISSDWFAPEWKTILFALTVTAGTMGAMIGGAPLAAMTKAWGWRETLMGLAVMGLVIFAANFLLLRNHPSGAEHPEDPSHRQDTWQAILNVFKSRLCWMYGTVAIGIYLSISVFADLWGVSFLMEKFAVSKEEAAGAISLIYMGTCIGCISVAILSQRVRYPQVIISMAALMIGTLLSIIVFMPHLSFFTTTILLFLIGIGTGGEILCFTRACESMSVSVAATVTGFINFVVTMGAALIQQQVGFILNWFWDGVTLDSKGVPLYTVQDYQGALSIVILITFASFFLSFFLIKSKAPALKRV
jgi:predicted MFS family arabinose efflux permease